MIFTTNIGWKRYYDISLYKNPGEKPGYNSSSIQLDCYDYERALGHKDKIMCTFHRQICQ